MNTWQRLLLLAALGAGGVKVLQGPNREMAQAICDLPPDVPRDTVTGQVTGLVQDTQELKVLQQTCAQIQKK